MAINTCSASYLEKTTHAAPLAVFRICFGLLMAIGIVRFWYNGWIEKLYLAPDFHFKYLGFSWVKVPSEAGCYLLFVVCGLSALLLAVGFKYRLSAVLFFLSFTYIELMDKTTYLNHYYFVSVMSFILIFLPAGKYFSLDVYRKSKQGVTYIPKWNIDVLKLTLAIVYIYAGAAKLNYDWLINAMPLTIWLPTKFDTPLLGGLMHEKWVHYLFSWSGAIYDLSIPFLLLWRRTRIWAFAAVVFFHIMTRLLFPIGMFPYIMIFSTLIFFSADFHNKILSQLSKWLRIDKGIFDNGVSYLPIHSQRNQWSFRWLALVILFQLLIPLRYLAYPGNIFWTEEGYRFSWRVMLMEKTGYANFKVVDAKSGKRFYVQNDDFLTPFQQKQMSTQPDFIIQYAHHLAQHFESQGHQNLEVYVESYASLNGRKSQPYIDPNVNLLTLDNDFKFRTYILPLDE